MSYQNDEVYLKQIFSPIADLFRLLIRTFYQTVQFLIKKWWLFAAAIILGAITGYFLDQQSGNKIIKQEVTLKPNKKSTSYIYNFIESIPYRADTEQNLEEIGLKSEWIKNIKSIKIEPITSIEDIFDHLHKEYQDKNFQYSMQDFSEKELERDKFTYIYKYHLLEVVFKTEKEYNKLITETILTYINTNRHFKKQVKLDIEQATESIKNNKNSLQFIDKYLEGVLEGSLEEKDENKVVIATNQSETTLLAGLLEQKNRILYAIKQDQKITNLGNEVFSVVNDSDIVIKKKGLLKRKIVQVPLALCIMICMWFVFLFLYRQMEAFVKTSANQTN